MSVEQGIEVKKLHLKSKATKQTSNYNQF